MIPNHAPLTSDQQSLVERHMGLANHIAMRIGPRRLLDDLTSVGYLGLCRAAMTWRPELGSFATYSGWWIRCYIRRAKEREFRNRGAPQDEVLHAPPSPETDPANIELLRLAFEQMTDKQVRAIVLHYGFGECAALGLEEAGHVMGVTRQRVQQIVASGVKNAQRRLV